MNVLGFDPGMGAIKLYCASGKVELPSQVATNGTTRLVYATGLSRRHAPQEVRTDSGSFYVGLGAHDYGRPVENLDYSRLTGSPEMQALFYGALSRLPKLPESLQVVVGLPVETLSGEQARENAAAVRAWLRGEHRWQVGKQEYRVQVEKVSITPQPIGALFDYVLGDDGRLFQERKQALVRETGVISIGFNTIEMVVVRNKAPVDRFTAGNTSGVRRLLELINHERLYSLGELDTMLRTGALDVRQTLSVWEREVTGVVERQWGSAWRRFFRVLLVGGGSVLLREPLLRYFSGKAYIADEPVMATARGLYKLGLKRSKK